MLPPMPPDREADRDQRATARRPMASPGQMRAQRETGEAIRMAHTALRRNASKKALRLKPETLERANFVILFTTFPATPFSAADMREWYRSRGWVEAAF